MGPNLPSNNPSPSFQKKQTKQETKNQKAKRLHKKIKKGRNIIKTNKENKRKTTKGKRLHHHDYGMVNMYVGFPNFS